LELFRLKMQRIAISKKNVLEKPFRWAYEGQGFLDG
jgi:hypothetical protein